MHRVVAGLQLGHQAVGVPLRPAAGRKEITFNDADAHAAPSITKTAETSSQTQGRVRNGRAGREAGLAARGGAARTAR